MTDTTFDSPFNTTFSGTPQITPNFSTANCGSGANDFCGLNPIAYTLFNYKLPNGQYLIPSANQNSVLAQLVHSSAYGTMPLSSIQEAMVTAFPEDAEVPGTAVFLAHQAVANLDWNPNSTHSFSAKYYYQHDPTIAPYAYSMVAGFSQRLDAGSQVVSLSHTQTVKSNLSITETFGFIREKAYWPVLSTNRSTRPSLPALERVSWIGQSVARLYNFNNLGTHYFPGISMVACSGTTLTPYASLLNEYRGGSKFTRGIDGGISKPLQSLGKRHMDAGKTYDYFRRQLLLHTAQHRR